MWLPDDMERGPELLVHLADQFQSQLSETEAAVPVCAGHAHPATAEVLNGEAWWTCPTHGTRIGRVGAL